MFIAGVTADKSGRMNSEVLRAILSAQTQPNTVKVIRRCFAVQVDYDTEHAAAAAEELFKTIPFLCLISVQGRMPLSY